MSETTHNSRGAPPNAIPPRVTRAVRQGQIRHDDKTYHASYLALAADETIVQVGYDSHEPSCIWVYNADGRYLGTAQWLFAGQKIFSSADVEAARDARAKGRLERLHRLTEAQSVPMSLKSVDGGDTARAENATAQLLMGSGGILDEKSSASTDTSHRAPVSDSSAAASAASNCSAENDLNTFSIMDLTSRTVEQLLEKFYRLFPPVVPITEARHGDALIDAWHQALTSLDDAEALAAARLWCSIGHRFPTPADLLDCAKTLRAVKAIWPGVHFPPLTCP